MAGAAPPVAIPVIDARAPDAAAAAGAACETLGCFHLTGAGLSRATLDTLLAESGSLFKALAALPEGDARRAAILAHPVATQFRGFTPLADEALADGALVGDAKEGLYFGVEAGEGSTEAGLPLHGANVWPDATLAPGLRAAVEAAFGALMTVCTTILLPMIATAAGEEGAFFEAAFAAGPPMAFLRPLHYPPVPSDPATVACGAHTDYGLVTLLHTDGGPGLEVEVGGAWRSVPPPAHDGDGATVFVNVGDMLERWSGGRFKAAKHRVVLPSPPRDRLSAAFFFDPPFRAVIDGVRYGDYILAKYRGTHASFAAGWSEGRRREGGEATAAHSGA